MKRPIAIITLAGFLLGAITPSAMAGDPVGNYMTSVTKVFGEVTKQRLILYMACAAYYAQFKKWPSSEKDLLMAEDSISKEGEDKDLLAYVIKTMDIIFKRAGANSVLIEGRYDDQIEKDLEKIGVGKCRLSVVASFNEKEIRFEPSDNAKGNKDFFNIPATLKAKEAKSLSK